MLFTAQKWPPNGKAFHLGRLADPSRKNILHIDDQEDLIVTINQRRNPLVEGRGYPLSDSRSSDKDMHRLSSSGSGRHSDLQKCTRAQLREGSGLGVRDCGLGKCGSMDSAQAETMSDPGPDEGNCWATWGDYMSYSLNSLRGDYLGDNTGKYTRVIKREY